MGMFSNRHLPPSFLACLLAGCAWLGLTRPSSVVHQMLGSAPRFCTGVCLFVTVSLETDQGDLLSPESLELMNLTSLCRNKINGSHLMMHVNAHLTRAQVSV